MGFYRKPSPLEITYAGPDTEETSPFVNQFFIEGEGEFHIKDWQDAVERVAEANPGSRLRLKGFWGWKYWDDKGPVPKVFEQDTDWSGNSSEGAPVLGNPMSIRKGPTAEIHLLKTSPPRVLFRTHHSITDGKGAVHWMQEVFRVLRGEPLQGSAGTYNEWDIVKGKEYPPREITEGHCAPVTPPSDNPSLKGCRWCRLTVPGKHTKILPKLIIAISNITRTRHGDDSKIIFRVPSDLRRYMPDNPDFSMANNTGTIDMQITPDLSVTDVQKKIVRAMRTKQDLSVFPQNMYLANWLPISLFRFRPELIEKKHTDCNYRMTGIISFLGDMDMKDFSYEKFTGKSFYGIPIPLEDRSITVGFTLNEGNGLDAVVNVPRALATQPELEQLCDDIKTELAAL